MRKRFEPQLQIGQVDIADIQFDLRSRDEIPKILIGLQHVFTAPELREKAFKILETVVPDDIDKSFGRPGMQLWNIFVIACLRVNCNWNFDKIHEMANQHYSIRLMLGHGLFDEYCYSLQSIKDNFALLTPTVIDQLNQLIVQAGHDCLPAGEIAELKGQCDSWVVETDVHYPTNNNLLFLRFAKQLPSLRMSVSVYKFRDGGNGNITLIRSNRYLTASENFGNRRPKTRNRKLNETKRFVRHTRNISITSKVLSLESRKV